MAGDELEKAASCESNGGDGEAWRRRKEQQGLAGDQNATASFGLTATMELRWILASGKWRPVLFLPLRCRRKWRRWTKATREDGNGG
uniref:Uncharacterized protein n=1 Tax=Oryza sativa subsp. japonica TaxID=39947 RepID=Q6Z9A1_ORYSJ|nr:hypothetical protein [Oryza sativa Japonica Group]